jgi:signal transduction histidine kinase
VALCLFRILQEALRNIVKHTNSLEAKVDLSAHGDELDLCISDSGAGFNPESVQRNGGLGITSMRERLKLVEGELSIESQLHLGTTVRARVPLGPPADSATASVA